MYNQCMEEVYIWLMISNRKGNKQVNDCTEKPKTYDTIPELGLPIEPIFDK